MPAVAFAADDRTPVTGAILDALRAREFEIVVHGPPAGVPLDWAHAGEAVGRDVAAGRAQTGIVCCSTGTGVSIAANKVAGVRAALCATPDVARDARRWNDANVLCLALATTRPEDVPAILDAWLTPVAIDQEELAAIAHLAAIEGGFPSRIGENETGNSRIHSENGVSINRAET